MVRDARRAARARCQDALLTMREREGSPLLRNHMVAGIAAEYPHGGAADDGLKVAQMRHISIAFIADARWHVRAIGRGNRIGGCHESALLNGESKVPRQRAACRRCAVIL
jgi:hypothetical protein